MDLSSLSDPLEAIPFGLRGLAGLVGVLLAVAGARLYRFAVLAPGLLLGLGAGLFLPESIDVVFRAIIAVTLSVFGALVCRFVEQAAVRTFGAIIAGGLVYLGWPLAMGEPSPWWGLAIGAGLGLLLFPRAFQALLKPLTAVLGALTLAFALGQGDNPLVVGGVALIGMVVQFSTGKKGKRPRPED